RYLGQAPALELVSRLSLAAIGLWLLIRAIRHSAHGHREGAAVGFAAGLVPCPLTLFMMTYAVSVGVPEARQIFSIAMLFGCNGDPCCSRNAHCHGERLVDSNLERTGKSLNALALLRRRCRHRDHLPFDL